VRFSTINTGCSTTLSLLDSQLKSTGWLFCFHVFVGLLPRCSRLEGCMTCLTTKFDGARVSCLPGTDQTTSFGSSRSLSLGVLHSLTVLQLRGRCRRVCGRSSSWETTLIRPSSQGAIQVQSETAKVGSGKQPPNGAAVKDGLRTSFRWGFGNYPATTFPTLCLMPERPLYSCLQYFLLFLFCYRRL
jgi:hypothetical protein